jgi:hypothetical protein
MGRTRAAHACEGVCGSSGQLGDAAGRADTPPDTRRHGGREHLQRGHWPVYASSGAHGAERAELIAVEEVAFHGHVLHVELVEVGHGVVMLRDLPQAYLGLLLCLHKAHRDAKHEVVVEAGPL